MRRALQTLTVAASSALVPSANAEVPFQQLADLGLGGAPYDVNASGVIVGAVRVERDSVGPYVPVIWQTPTSEPVELPTVEGGYAVAINSLGDIVGTEFQPTGPYGVPVLWTNGERFVLPDLGEGAFANDINEAGVIVGSVIVKGQYRAARWVNRELELLPLPEFETDDGVVWSLANSINSSGVITGTIQAPVATPSVALRWDSKGVAMIESGGLETKGIAIDNLGGIAVNGYFDGGSSRAPAVVGADGTVDVLSVPSQYLFGASATTMSRSGIVAGYYYGDVAGTFGIRAVAWPNGVFTPLEMPAGQRYAFPGGVGSNGIVFGSATDGVTGRSVPGFWALDIEESSLRSTSVSGERGQTIELSAESFRASGANVGHSVAARVDGVVVGQAVTNASGVARIAFMIPETVKSTEITVVYTDENGATTTSTIEVEASCASADLNCDGLVDASDLSALLVAWGTSGSSGSSGSADIDGDGVVGASDLSLLLANWGSV